MEKKDISTPVRGFLEKATGRRKQSCDSPFYLLPNVSTPPSRLMKIKNPFEPLLTEKLHTHLISPSIIFKKHTPKEERKFKWNIDEISMMKPADIDETSIQQHESFEDPALESFAQANIDKFFSMKEIVPSPFHSVKQEPLIEDKSSTSHSVSVKDCATQTMLTLPFNLPPELEEALKPYFTYDDDQESDSKSNSLFRQLFEAPNLNDTCSSTSSSPVRDFMPPHFIGVDQGVDEPIRSRCDFGTPKNVFSDDCGISPICTGRDIRLLKAKSKSISSLNFTQRINLDVSMGVVPNNDSINLECSYEAMEEGSRNNWEMDCKSIIVTTPTKSTSSDEMDVSNSNTPHSRRFSNSRKKLSDSFPSDEDIESKTFNSRFQESMENKATSSKFINDVTDRGYVTASYSHEESEWTSSNLYASTPTKNKCN